MQLEFIRTVPPLVHYLNVVGQQFRSKSFVERAQSDTFCTLKLFVANSISMPYLRLVPTTIMI